jgi:hypothetical protein
VEERVGLGLLAFLVMRAVRGDFRIQVVLVVLVVLALLALLELLVLTALVAVGADLTMLQAQLVGQAVQAGRVQNFR